MVTVVVDSSVLFALVAAGLEGEWAHTEVRGHDLAAPHLAPFETANILRRHEMAGLMTSSEAVQAHADLVDLPVDLVGYGALVPRAWDLRANLTSYDASYVALAEALGVPLVTLDRRLARAPALGCDVRTPDS
ncbi:type II toxin-antitoxin system VapC family toxin [Iamia sp.]|uniref:type II toxin-antitoxin system VapC family toxin n=1 Tax=Iamia sp. TaxID=2722710 RepID=UPI002BCE1E47|nr:type II toxin-antitoxin system VapC family toxin [Iamia sp.]HXH57521.1 type II toxin-antitoxin system VapC family toxin [Iamia sp.]